MILNVDGGVIYLSKHDPRGMGLDGGTEERIPKSTSKKQQTTTPDNKTGHVKDVASGAKQATGGAAKIKSGNVVGGAKDVASGTKQSLKGVNNLRGAKGQDAELDDVNEASEMANVMDDPYNPDSYESIFDDDDVKDKGSDRTNDKKNKSDRDKGLGLDDSDDDKDDDPFDLDEDDDDDGDDEDDTDKDKDDNEGKGIKDLLSDEDDDSIGEDDDISLKDIGDAAGKAASAGQAYSSFMSIRALLQFLQMLQAMATKAIAYVGGLWSAISGAVVGAFQGAIAMVSSALGISAMVSAVGVISTVVVASATVVATVVSNVSTDNIMKSDTTVVCIPDTTAVGDSTLEWEASGESHVMYQENLEKAWSVMTEIGFDKKPLAAILGNFSAESGLDPTNIETIFGEAYEVGPKTAAAVDADFDMGIINPAYQRRFPGVKRAGVGISQWSNGRNKTFIEYAKEHGDWFDIGIQFRYMLEADNKSDRDILYSYANKEGSVDELTESFMNDFLRPSKDALRLSERRADAVDIYMTAETIIVDTEYADSILSGINIDTATSNHHGSAYMQDDGCGDEVGSHYSHTVDGTGIFPPDIVPVPWSPATLPDSLKGFAKDPGIYLEYGGNKGWNSTTYPGQCVSFAHSFMMNLYGVDPLVGADGGGVAKLWYDTYHDELGGHLTKVPQAGAVFSHFNGGVHGHTGVVDHVFANGDIIISEQNVGGISGDNNNTPRTWGWRYFPAHVYQEDNLAKNGTYKWQFYKPDREPLWNGDTMVRQEQFKKSKPLGDSFLTSPIEDLRN